jgi:superfamily II DNA helicase RecQ
MPSLYILLRGLTAISSAEHGAVLFSAPNFDGDCVTVHGQNLHLHQFKKMVEELEEEISQDLDSLLFNDPIFQLPEDIDILDEPRRTAPQYSFVDDKRNVWHKTTSVLQYIMDHSHIFADMGIVVESKIRWYPSALHEYAANIYHLQQKILVAIILTYGEPARATELASNLLRNYPGGSIRNIFFAFGTLFLRGSYNKTSFFTGRDKVMVRAPLPAIARHFIRFLVFLRPLYSEFQRVIRPDMYQNSLYFLFSGLSRPLQGPDVSKILFTFTEKKLKVGLSTSIHRQLMAFITSQNRRVFAKLGLKTTTDEQLGHSSQIDRQHYGLDENVPGQMDFDSLKTGLEISGAFHMLFGLGAELYSATQASAPRVRRLLEEMEQIKNPSIASLPTSATTPLSTASLASDLAHHLSPYLARTVQDKVDESHAAVVHLFSPGTVSSNTTYLSSPSVVHTHPSLLLKLREIMGNDTDLLGFSNLEQAQATQLLVEGRRSLALVTPTGSGKTMPALLCSKYFDEGRTTVWILPLKSMHEQYLLRCQEYQMSCERWSPTMAAANAPQHLLVTIESTQSDSFHAFIQELVSAKRMARVILDEVHLLLTHEHFRPVMKTLHWLGQNPIQIMLLTATLPPSLQGALFEKVGLTAPLLLRIPTPRPNISFHAVHVQKKEDVADRVVKEHKRAETVGDRMLIFCQSRNDVEKYSSLVSSPGVHAGLEQDEITNILARFRRGEVRTIVATCLLGVGLDVPSVTHVIHAGLPPDTLSFMQEVGRLGRDEATQKAWSIVVDCKTTAPIGNTDLFGRTLLRQWFQDSTNCRRLALQTFLDGQATPCSMLSPKVHLCDNCQREQLSPFDRAPVTAAIFGRLPTAPPTQLSKPMPLTSPTLQIAAHHSRATYSQRNILPESKLYRSVRNIAETFQFRCIACCVRRLDDRHKFEDCNIRPSIKNDGHVWLEWRQKLNFKTGTCFQCGLPQHVSNESDNVHHVSEPCP